MKEEKINQAEDYLIQNSFQNYCAGNDAECVRYWDNYIKANPDNMEQITEAKKIYSILNGGKRPLNTSISQLADQLESPHSKVFSFIHTNVLKIAAMIIGVVGVSLAIYFYGQADLNKHQLSVQNTEIAKDKIIQVNNGERKKLNLPDGTTVLLNAGSTLTISGDFTKGDRKVTLDGEGYFDVTHNKTPFIVYTKNFNVKVLGTQFNIKSYSTDKFAEASLIEGAVELVLVNRKNDLLALKPGEKLTVRNTQDVEQTNDISTSKGNSIEEIKLSTNTAINENLTLETAWTTNRIEFRNESFSNIKSTLERWYDVEIDVQSDEVNSYEFTAIFTSETIVEALHALQKAKYFNYKVQDHNIIITK